jgi:hypothetical protein
LTSAVLPWSMCPAVPTTMDFMAGNYPRTIPEAYSNPLV